MSKIMTLILFKIKKMWVRKEKLTNDRQEIRALCTVNGLLTVYRRLVLQSGKQQGGVSKKNGFKKNFEIHQYLNK